MDIWRKANNTFSYLLLPQKAKKAAEILISPDSPDQLLFTCIISVGGGDIKEMGAGWFQSLDSGFGIQCAQTEIMWSVYMSAQV
ncbi:hypothetical protein XELAEV_18030958mg [Xenopus laevis]|uniref:Uncharacterized protein n=1 Tax=Xenopus laevis TaxID=8355 RepID=A0A974HF92_XENLA|nr:hypothetical protein XELAEV_18030958mg [Xenopus laevis]